MYDYTPYFHFFQFPHPNALASGNGLQIFLGHSLHLYVFDKAMFWRACGRLAYDISGIVRQTLCFYLFNPDILRLEDASILS